MPKEKKLSRNPNFPEMEKSILDYWEKTEAFKKQVEMRPEDKQYVFYDGPPFATGLPHYGHLLGSTSKDVIARYWAMKGYRVERVWGWDCHGLPIENMVEQQLGIKGGKKGIEELGIAKFNAACRSEVMKLDQEWERIIARLGRWVDFANNYKTMDTDYMESVWWGFNQLHEKGLIYEGRKVVMYCPRCATPLSNFEIAMDNSYEMTEDYSLIVKFKAKDVENEFFLAWTTTPWTLPGNVGLAVDPTARYAQVQIGQELLWLAEKRLEALLTGSEYQIVKTVDGSELVGQAYEPLFPYLEAHRTEKAWTVLPANFVSLDEGSGIVHTAAIYGEDDYALALEYNLPLVPTLDDNGKFKDFVELVAGQFYKKAEDAINENLTDRGLMFKLERFEHSYPFCYRCGTPLYYSAVPAWFINIDKMRDQLLAQNENINWYPSHLKHGRFGKGIATAPDWNISRSRYWGTPMPIWRDEASGKYRVISSRDELREWAVDPNSVGSLDDIHREFIDEIEVWVDDDRTLKGKRIPEVFDCWVESGSMPFAQRHYPFENKQKFEETYPAQFVSEYIAQTRAWFYTMHVMSMGIFGKHAVENILTTGTIMAADGSKMSKSKKNFPDPLDLINKYGVDSLRLYLMSSPVMKATNFNFDEKEVGDIRKKVFNIWYNTFAFYHLYAGDNQASLQEVPQASDVMDQWVLSRLNTVTKQVLTYMDNYDVVRSSRILIDYVDELSTWYLRRSRERLRNSDHSAVSIQVFGHVLLRLAQLAAPFTPFFSEWLYHQMTDGNTSIHHTDLVEADEKLINPELEEAMAVIRKVTEKTHSARKEAGVKVRQPLAAVQVTSTNPQPPAELLTVLMDEVNVKSVSWTQDPDKNEVELNLAISPELQAEGEARELMRQIQKLRKAAGLAISQQATVTAPTWPVSWQAEIEEKTNSRLTQGTELALVE